MIKFVATAIIAILIAVLSGGLQDILPPLTGAQEEVNIPKGKSIMDMQQTSDPEDCQVEKRPVPIDLDESDYPETTAHVREAWKSGEVRVMHLDREGADQNREESLAGIATKDGYDRDEYPMAVSMEGGQGASVKYVAYADNRGAGSSVGSQLGEYCSGQAFFLQIVP